MSPSAWVRTPATAHNDAVGWEISGSYFESCSCDAICPCRRIDGVAGGRSTHGECHGVLSWLIEEGHADGVDLAGQPVAMAIRYSDDEDGSPWTWILYLSDVASPEQRQALDAIFQGHLEGDQPDHFPWVRKSNSPVAVRAVAIDVDHARRRQWLRIRDRVTVRVRDRYPGQETVTCVIPGHDREGEEVVADELRVDDGPLSFSFSGTCGYGSTFAYAGSGSLR